MEHAAIEKRIGFVGGGNLAEAIIGGLIKNRVVQPGQIIVSDVRRARLAELAAGMEVRTTPDNREAVAQSDVVFLTVKPQVVRGVLLEIRDALREDQLVITPCAGILTRSIERMIDRAVPVVRIMPNIAALVNESATALCPGQYADEAHTRLAADLCRAFGLVEEIDEQLMDSVTGLSGSGPAYMFLVIDALADAGVKVGLRRDQARRLVGQTVLGAAKLLLETGEHPSELKDMVTSPGGTAITGLAALEEGGLRTTLISAVEKATRRSAELGALLNSDEK